MKKNKPNVLITGASGYLGREVLTELWRKRRRVGEIVALDIREPASGERREGVTYLSEDIRSPRLREIMQLHRIDVVVHLAAIVQPAAHMTREFLHDVEVNGTRNVLEACVAAGARKIIVTSSGAVYGYHPDHPPWLEEFVPLRGNPAFPYADHKRQVEELLLEYRKKHPRLQQLIFRPGTVLGEKTNNLITNLFRKAVILGIRGGDSRFVFIWDRDVAAVIVVGVLSHKTGIYNLAGDGTLTLREIARILHRPYIALPAGVVKTALWILKKLHLTQYGPEQVDFLRYRPVLSNWRLKQKFKFTPRKTSREVFEYYLAAQRGQGNPRTAEDAPKTAATKKDRS